MPSHRIFFVGGNWKMQASLTKCKEVMEQLKTATIDFKTREVIVSPPFVFLPTVVKDIRPEIKVAAQNCYKQNFGAFTGEISAPMLKDIDIEWVILGHSERRHILKECNTEIGLKIKHALSCGLSVIACIGELLSERDANETEKVLTEQLNQIIENVHDWSKVVIAYEPVWAIGTGVTATPEQAEEAHLFVRKYISEKVSGEISEQVRIIYGGSVTGSNCTELSHKPNVDGFLVGGASLKAEFIDIINCK